MGDNGRRALAYPVIEKDAEVIIPAGTTSWKWAGGWIKSVGTAQEMRGTVQRTVAGTRHRRDGTRLRGSLAVVRFDDGREYAFEIGEGVRLRGVDDR